MSRAFDATRHCGATNRQGTPCTQPLGFGTDHAGSGRCKHHGGSTTTGKKHGAKEAAAKTLAALAIPVEGDPLEVLQAAVESAYGVLLAARDLLVQNVDAAHVDLYLASIERASRVAKGAAEAVNEERLTKLKERETTIYEGALMRAADRFGIKPARREVFLTMVREELVAGLQEYTH